MNDLSFHFAPNPPWLPLALALLAAVALALWAYRFRIPPLSAIARVLLPVLRALVLVLLLALLAQPVLERVVGGSPRVVALVDRSRSMQLRDAPDGVPRSQRADAALEELKRAWRGRATIQRLGFGSRLEADTARGAPDGVTALGTALSELARSPDGQAAGAVVVFSDGVVNSGDDPAAAARALGIPVHTVLIGDPARPDRAVSGIDAPERARAGELTPVRVRVTTNEPQGTPLPITLSEPGHDLGRTTVIAPGGMAEVTAEFRVTPSHPGLAVWTARVDSLRGESTAENDARQVAVEVSPGRLGVRILSAGVNWDLGFLRRAIAGDSSLAVSTYSRERDGWIDVERGASAATPSAATLRGASVVILDALEPTAVAPGFDKAIADFVRGGGGLLLLGGPGAGVTRFARGALVRDLALSLEGRAAGASAGPAPSPEARELLQWDDDPARGDRAWRSAAPLSEIAPIAPGGGDRVLIASSDGGPPLLIARRIGRGQALLVNGTGLWRWSLNPHDELSAERGRRLWRRIVRWLAEPVQGEPLRVRPERWLTAGGEPVRLFATLQDANFRPLAGATVRGEVTVAGGRARPVTFQPAEAGSYVAQLDDLPPGRHRVTARAERGGRPLGTSSAEFAVDRWSLEMAHPLPDSSTLAAVAAASGGASAMEGSVAAWARRVPPASFARQRHETTALWESPWLFMFLVTALGIEWMWRRRRGLP